MLGNLKHIYIISQFLLLVFIFSMCQFERKETEEKIKNAESIQKLGNTGFPKFEFTKEIHKFGKILEGEIVVYDFYYKNVGTTNLIISKIETSCGCTAVKWNKEPLQPGKEDKLTVQFDSKGRSGKQYKVITIFCNSLEGVKELVITAIVN